MLPFLSCHSKSRVYVNLFCGSHIKCSNTFLSHCSPQLLADHLLLHCNYTSGTWTTHGHMGRLWRRHAPPTEPFPPRWLAERAQRRRGFCKVFTKFFFLLCSKKTEELQIDQTVVWLHLNNLKRGYSDIISSCFKLWSEIIAPFLLIRRTCTHRETPKTD